MDNRTIGWVARRLGVRVDTIRFYERRGVIEPPPRTRSGYRIYDEKIVRRLHFVLQAKELGFALAEIRELLDIESSDRARCSDVKVRAENKLAAIDRRIGELRKITRALSILVTSCPGEGPTDGCTILDSLRDQSFAGLPPGYDLIACEPKPGRRQDQPLDNGQ